MQTITQKILEDTIYNYGVPVLTCTIRYPFFTTTCSESAALSINAFYSSAAKKTEEYCRTVLASQAAIQAKYAQKENYPFFGYEFISAFTVTWNSNCITSLFTDQYTYTGGAHGSTVRTSDTWNFCSGQRLSLADFYPHNPSYQKSIIMSLNRQIAAREKNAPSTYFEDYPKLTDASFQPENFYASPQGITIYFQQYDIAPYSTGIPEFLLPFKKIQ